jgi:hypothetical protein
MSASRIFRPVFRYLTGVRCSESNTGFQLRTSAFALPILLTTLMHAAEPVKSRVPVLVELFTSEGCSSCPPADDVLAKLDAQQPVKEAEIVILSEHVDYWNYLGWKDPYSTAQSSARQKEYAAVFGKRGVYTPQVVVNGRAEVVGSDERAVRREIQKAARAATANVNAVIQGVDSNGYATISVKASRGAGEPAIVWLAITESGLSNAVKNGENGGRTLKHSGVARVMVKAGELSGSDTELSKQLRLVMFPDWKKEHLKVVAFIQETGSKRILGAVSVPFR